MAILQNTVGQLCKPGANACCGDQGKPGAEEPSREQRFSGSERRGADLYGDLVQQTGVVKLRCEAAAAHDPHIPTVGSREHLRVSRANVAVGERYVGTFNLGNSRLVKTQVGWVYGHAVSVCSETVPALRRIHS